ncbi:LysR family transcriptional regulator [Nitrospirillum pindoramense]|uniref:LysR family transcriptional regulator n=1 Tax=Nitrospirillum amazonense TaxID=28077 RepID=A0A560HEH4_9PROT|nr:LysR family transcriptional regulator [Nitrospirillum amazonense]TWB43780.1 LysR family transcriptional regulator [Nitrospirillum amazonense]
MEDLNDLAFFAAVASHGSFSAAALALGVPKSKVSRRVAELEARLGVRLLQRSTRAVQMTAVGLAFHTHCLAMTQAARAALELAEQANEQPSGRLRISSPIGVAHLFLAPVLAKFMRMHPAVQVELDLTNRRVDVIGEGVDIALRIRSSLEDSHLVMRRLGSSPQLLVASPSFIQRNGPFDAPAALSGVTGLGPAGVRGERNFWHLKAPNGMGVEVEYVPALITDDVQILEQATTAGLGVAQLPAHLCGPALADGRLAVLLPDHRMAPHELHAVFPSRRGMVPAVRAFLDFLAEEMPAMMEGAVFDDGARAPN